MSGMKTVMSLKKNIICMMYKNKKYNPVMSGLRPDITDYYVSADTAKQIY